MAHPFARIIRRDNVLQFPDLAGPPCFTSFQLAIYDGTKAGYLDFLLDFRGTGRVFPEAAVPIAAYLDMHKEEGLVFSTRHAPPYLVKSCFMSPLRVSTARNRDINFPLSKIWKFTDTPEVAQLVSLFVKALSSQHICATGVLEGFEWCLNEVMDNVLQHSNGSAGFVMMQIHKDSRRLSVCIADHGQGILCSLSTSKYHPSSSVNAITLAVKAGVTRDPAVGQGNGLWGLSEIVRLNEARLNIMSGSGALYFDGQSTRTFEQLPCNHVQPGTAVDFGINLERSVDVSAALGGGTSTHINLRMESLETPEGNHCIQVQTVSHGTGTRRSAEQVRTFVLNTFAEGANRVLLDFADVGMVSSSFADELVGKLVVHFGFSCFCQRVELKNVNPTIQTLIDRAVAQRISQNMQVNTDIHAGQQSHGGVSLTRVNVDLDLPQHGRTNALDLHVDERLTTTPALKTQDP